MPDSPRITARHVVPCVAVLIASLVCGGCTGQGQAAHRGAGGTDPVETPASSPVSSGPVSSAPAASGPASSARPATLQEIAAALGCAAEVTVDAEELKEGACGAGEEGYRMVTFSADQGQRAWLAESRMYGGTYLVGNRWVVTAASAEALAPLREHLGGTVETGDSHGAEHTPGHGGSEHSTAEHSTPDANTADPDTADPDTPAHPHPEHTVSPPTP
ncbi:hypothetical protein [Streptomyces sp. ISL-86]|uniref:hypothetical protein n=1 Tax=Streptomyces sp. ISL-86 TaxID=2819187 RepID=UPI001BEBED12|nr:hypothetical protein [Streptomyces sp. ISL-86]MBT2457555.1 hypothetical protein [Streptomyces sp. ISL-86]